MSKPIKVTEWLSKPERVVVTVPVSHWHCGSSRCDKKHESADTASRCPFRRKPLAERAETSFERNERIVALRDSGMTFKAIGEKVGRWDDPSVPISGHRVSQVYKWHIRRRLTPYIAKHLSEEQARRIYE